jgi:SAM-dependent methyltransferase
MSKKIIYGSKICWCGNENDELIFNKQPWHCLSGTVFSLVRCNSCNTIRTSYCEFDDYELNVYSQLSDRHYNSINIFKQNYNEGSILDVGCNKGLFLKEIKKNCDKIIKFKGIDNYENAMIQKEDSLDLENVTLQQLSERGEKYDNIIMIHVLEHFIDLNKLFEDLKKVSKIGTNIYFCVPNHEGVGHIPNFGALDPREHFYHFSKDTLLNLIKYFFKCDIIHVGTSNIWNSNEQLDVIFKIKEI